MPGGKPGGHSHDHASERQEDLRRTLLRLRGKVLKDTQTELSKYIKGEDRQLVESVLDSGDWTVIDLNEDVKLRILRSHTETLAKVDEAIRKLDEGTYGTCDDCGDEINPERLKILPFAIRCRDCQEVFEEAEATGGRGEAEEEE